MNEYVFEATLRAVVRVRAADEASACKVVPSVLGAPGSVEIGLANQNNNAGFGNPSVVTDVEFHQESSPKRTKHADETRTRTSNGSWKRQERTGDALPKQAQRVVEEGRALQKAAKGLGAR